MNLLSKRTILAGFAGGLALNFMMILTFRLLGFGMDGGGILLDPSLQSSKLIAVWTEIDPIPLVVNDPIPIIIGLLLFGIGHSFISQMDITHMATKHYGKNLAYGTFNILFFFSFLGIFYSIQPFWRTPNYDWFRADFLGNNCCIRGVQYRFS